MTLILAHGFALLNSRDERFVLHDLILILNKIDRPVLAEGDDMDSAPPSGCNNAPSELMSKRGVHVITLARLRASRIESLQCTSDDNHCFC
jgi:hypothetical protein